MPYPVDLAGKPAPWTLPTKDALTIGAEYFDNVSLSPQVLLLVDCTAFVAAQCSAVSSSCGVRPCGIA